MPPHKEYEPNNTNFEQTRIKYRLRPDQESPSTNEITVQFDLVTPARVMTSFPDMETIQASELFRDVQAFVVRHFAVLEDAKESKYYAKLALHSTTFATFCYYFASSYDKQLYFATIHAWGAILDDWIESQNKIKPDSRRVEILGYIVEFIATGEKKGVMFSLKICDRYDKTSISK
ncbi:hypothetical protein Fcan01_25761 [Folsomia candida]|uniref:Uncharacterized protein n=1 Tax=Folsomia candida TaxID=158441 RepID=A0A226D312_FOLCA|nr:hypothetical protein Fcan01_25761 [Folsomia candida]